MLRAFIRKILGAICISTCSMVFIGGFIHLGFTLLGNTDLSIPVFFCIFISTFMLLLGCISLYHVNTTLWNSVHSAKEKSKGSILNLLPDIKGINDFLEYIGTI